MSALTDLAGAINDSVTNIATDIPIVLPAGKLLLIDNEVLLITSEGEGTNVTRGVAGTTAASHDDESSVYEVVSVFHVGTIEVHYVDVGVGVKILNITTSWNPQLPKPDPDTNAPGDPLQLNADMTGAVWVD